MLNQMTRKRFVILSVILNAMLVVVYLWHHLYLDIRMTPSAYSHQPTSIRVIVEIQPIRLAFYRNGGGDEVNFWWYKLWRWGKRWDKESI